MTLIRPGETVPFYSSVPRQVMEWLQSAEAQQVIASAANAAESSIASLNKERQVQREELHQPITL
nr:hypothetical protein [uncultured Pseudomonas sp.]